MTYHMKTTKGKDRIGLIRHFRRRHARRKQTSRATFHPAVEPLEPRLLLTTVPIINEFQELLADDPARKDHFGKSVDISGNIAVVGAYQDDDQGRNSGSAYIFQHDGESWTQVDKLTAIDGARNDEFGNSVAIHGDDNSGYTVAIMGGGEGYVFQSIYNDGSFEWRPQTTLTPGQGGAFSGSQTGGAISIFNDTIVIGASGDDTVASDAGAVYVFKDESLNGDWSITSSETLFGTGLQTGDSFGNAVSISGNTLVVASEPAAYVFENSGDTWNQAARLTRSDEGVLGRAVAVSESGDTIVASSVWRTFVYSRPESTAAWRDATEDVRLLPWDWHDANPETEDSFRFGFSLDVSNDTIVVGAVSSPGGGAAYVFERDDPNTPEDPTDDWQEHALLQSGDDTEGGLGIQVRTNGTIVLAADHNDNAEPFDITDAGAVYVFPRDPGPGTLSITDATVTEGDSGATFVTLDVSRSGSTKAAASVDYVTQDVTANAPTDYVAVTPATLTFHEGETTKTLTFTVSGDTLEESDETFEVVLSNPSGATIDKGTGVVTIQDDDSQQSASTTLYVSDISFQSRRGGRERRVVVEIRSDSNADGLANAGDEVRAGVLVKVKLGVHTLVGTTDDKGIFRSEWIGDLESGIQYANVVDLALVGYLWGWDPLDPLSLDLEDDNDGDGKPDKVLVI